MNKISLMYIFYYLITYVSCSHDLRVADTVSIILDFMFLRNSRLGTIYECGTTAELVHLSHLLTASSIRDYPERYPAFNIINLSSLSEDIHLPEDQTVSVIDLRCGSKVVEIIDKCSVSWCFNEGRSWIALGNNPIDARKYFQNANLNLDTQLFFVAMSQDQIPWAVYDIYRLGYAQQYPLNITLYGYWLPSTTVSMEAKAKSKVTSKEAVTISRWRLFTADTWIQRRNNWQGMLIRAAVATTYKPPTGGFFKYLSTPVNVHLDTMHRHNYELYTYLMEMYNFHMSIKRTNTWGVVQNGSWSGVIGTLSRGEVEFSITPIQFKMDRIGVVDHTAISWLARPCFIFRHPRVNEDAWLISFSRPFSLSVWIACLVFTALAVLVNHLTSNVEVNQSRSGNEDDLGGIVDNSWSYSIYLWAIAAFSQQGLMQDYRYISGRMTSLSLLVFCLITYQFYSAFLVSSLLMEPTKTITTLGDLLDSNLNIAIEDIAYNWDYFDITTDPVARKMFKKKIAPPGKRPNAFTPEEGLKKVNKGGWAFHVDVATAYKIIAETFDDSAICDLTEIQLFPPKETVTIVRKGSPFRQPISVGLRLQQTSGVLSHSRRVWHAPRPSCARSGLSALEAAGAEDVAFLPLMLILGGVTAAIALGIERYRFRMVQRSLHGWLM